MTRKPQTFTGIILYFHLYAKSTKTLTHGIRTFPINILFLRVEQQAQTFPLHVQMLHSPRHLLK